MYVTAVLWRYQTTRQEDSTPLQVAIDGRRYTSYAFYAAVVANGTSSDQ